MRGHRDLGTEVSRDLQKLPLEVIMSSDTGKNYGVCDPDSRIRQCGLPPRKTDSQLKGVVIWWDCF